MMTRFILFSLLLSCCISCRQDGGNTQKTTTTDTVFVQQPQNTAGGHTDTIVLKTPETQASEPSSGNGEVSSDRLIVPGESIGKTPLGMDAQRIEGLLGKPDMSDAAMGKAWLTWYGTSRDEHNNKTELDIYTTYKDNSMRQKTVQQIRVTSSYFKTEDGVGVYNSLEEIKKFFPGLKQVARYKDNGRVIRIYDDVSKGISFDVAEAGKQLICTAVVVHFMGKPVTQTYIYLHPGTELLS